MLLKKKKKVMMKMLNMDFKLILIILLITGSSFFSCVKYEKKDVTRIVLVRCNKEGKVCSLSDDSIVFLYKKIDEKKTYFYQSFNIGDYKDTNSFYLYKADSVTYFGIEGEKDSLFFYPYYSVANLETVWYKVDNLIGGTGFTKKTGEDNEAILLEGNLFLLNYSDTVYWLLDKDQQIERIKLGGIDFCKKYEDSISFPKDFYRPLIKTVDVFHEAAKPLFIEHSY